MPVRRASSSSELPNAVLGKGEVQDGARGIEANCRRGDRRAEWAVDGAPVRAAVAAAMEKCSKVRCDVEPARVARIDGDGDAVPAENAPRGAEVAALLDVVAATLTLDVQRAGVLRIGRESRRRRPAHERPLRV